MQYKLLKMNHGVAENIVELRSKDEVKLWINIFGEAENTRILSRVNETFGWTLRTPEVDALDKLHDYDPITDLEGRLSLGMETYILADVEYPMDYKVTVTPVRDTVASPIRPNCAIVHVEELSTGMYLFKTVTPPAGLESLASKVIRVANDMAQYMEKMTV